MTSSSAMLFRRWKRPILLAIAAVVVIVTTTTLSVRSAVSHDSHKATTLSSQKQQSCPTAPPSKTFVPDTHGRFNWRSVAMKHPVETLIVLPTEKPTQIPAVQHSFDSEPNGHDEERSITRRKAVKDVFLRCWKSYEDRAWLKDELAPMTGDSKVTFGGWGATLIDSLDTLKIMGLDDEYSDAVAAAVEVDFGPQDGEINMFETIIRYLGGYIAAYDIGDCLDQRLLNKAVEVADMAYASYDTENRMPVTRWHPQKAANGEEQYPASSGIIAEMASASVEFTRLSQLTGDMRYFDAISRITNIMDEQQGSTKIPGMWPVGVDVRAADLRGGSEFSLGAMADSAYEYLPKTFQLLAGRGAVGAQYQRMYESAFHTAIEHTMFRPMAEDKADILMTTSAHVGGKSSPVQHLGCFAGGMFALGGKLSGNDSHVEIGRKLADGCAWAYRSAPLGIMPEVSSIRSCPGLDNCEYTAEPGASPFIQVADGRYILRPEAIESIFYLYRITGDSAYQDVAWDMFEAIEKSTKTEFANAALKDVMRDPPGQDNSMESFWTAETLKYLYLIFSEPSLVSLDDFVFNTEAHPFRIQHG